MLKGNEWIERERKNKKNVTVQLCHSLTQKIRKIVTQLEEIVAVLVLIYIYIYIY